MRAGYRNIAPSQSKSGMWTHEEHERKENYESNYQIQPSRSTHEISDLTERKRQAKRDSSAVLLQVKRSGTEKEHPLKTKEKRTMKAIIKYSRHGAVKYISHLDMQRAFGRAVRRANLPAEYSHGFNPHIVMSFAAPLSVGYETEGDYLELSLAQDMRPEEVKRALNAVLPTELRVLHVHAVSGTKKLMAQSESAAYRVKFHFQNDEDCGKIKEAAERLCAAERYIARDRKNRELDIRPLLLEAEVQEDEVRLLLKNASGAALNPAVVAEALLQEAGLQAGWSVCRTECYTMENGKRIPFYEYVF